jgi:hypothetical protein
LASIVTGKMKILKGLAASLACFNSVDASLLAAGRTQPRGSTSVNISSVKIQRDLGTQLSSSTTIFGPSNPAYSNATHRWDTFAAPTVLVVVEIGVESDVAKVVSLCFFSWADHD